MIEPASRPDTPLNRITLQAMSLFSSDGRWLNQIMTLNERMFKTKDAAALKLLATASKKIWEKRTPGVELAPLPSKPETLSIRIPEHNPVKYSTMHELLCMHINAKLVSCDDTPTQEKLTTELETRPGKSAKSALCKGRYWVVGDNKEDLHLLLHPSFLTFIVPKQATPAISSSVIPTKEPVREKASVREVPFY